MRQMFANNPIDHQALSDELDALLQQQAPQNLFQNPQPQNQNSSNNEKDSTEKEA